MEPKFWPAEVRARDVRRRADGLRLLQPVRTAAAPRRGRDDARSWTRGSARGMRIWALLSAGSERLVAVEDVVAVELLHEFSWSMWRLDVVESRVNVLARRARAAVHGNGVDCVGGATARPAAHCPGPAHRGVSASAPPTETAYV